MRSVSETATRSAAQQEFGGGCLAANGTTDVAQRLRDTVDDGDAVRPEAAIRGQQALVAQSRRRTSALEEVVPQRGESMPRPIGRHTDRPARRHRTPQDPAATG